MADTTSISCEYRSYGQTRYASAGSGPQSSADHLSLQLAGVSVLEASVTAVLLFELHLGSRFVPPLIAPAEAMADSRSRDSLRTSWD